MQHQDTGDETLIWWLCLDDIDPCPGMPASEEAMLGPVELHARYLRHAFGSRTATGTAQGGCKPGALCHVRS